MLSPTTVMPAFRAQIERCTSEIKHVIFNFTTEVMDIQGNVQITSDLRMAFFTFCEPTSKVFRVSFLLNPTALAQLPRRELNKLQFSIELQ